MLMPKRVKHRKQIAVGCGATPRSSSVSFGEYGLKSLERGWITNRQIEAARIAMTRKIKRGGKVWINVFPDKPYTKKPAETRMGSGKGNPEVGSRWSSPVGLCSSWPACRRIWPAKHCAWPATSCPVKTRFIMREGAEA